MSRRPARRPVLLPALRRLWRDQHRLQIGTDPTRAVVLELRDPGFVRLFDLLDGTRTEATVLRAAAASGVSAGEVEAILTALRGAGYVVDACALYTGESSEPTRRRWDVETTALALRAGAADPNGHVTIASAMTRRKAAQVLVSGSSHLAVPIATTLAASGIGHLDTAVTGVARLSDVCPAGLLPSDTHRPRGVAAAEALRRAAPDIDLAPLRPGGATFAVIVGYCAPAALTALAYGTRRLAHLAVTVRDATVVVGPLVRPGQTPCLNCLDLHRLDRDPDWLSIAAQLITGPDTVEPVAATTALAAAAYAAAEVLTHIDGGVPTTLGATVEIAGPSQVKRRRWSQHPRCGCHSKPRSQPTPARASATATAARDPPPTRRG